jgi:hypothetical protein
MHAYEWGHFSNRAAMEKSQVNYWQLVWFFSMEKRDQEALLGSTERPWFIEENKDNLGANCKAFAPNASHQ